MAYQSNLVDSSKSHPKRLFSYINRRLKRSDELPMMSTPSGQLIEDDCGRASLLAETFASVFSSSHPPPMIDLSDTDIPQCSPTEVLDLLSHLNEHKAPGPDGIHPLVLKRLSPCLASPLAHLFSASIRHG